jgi:hypothetical protein
MRLFAVVVAAVVVVVSVFVHQSKSPGARMFKSLLKHAFARGTYKGVETKWTPELGSFYALSATDIDGNNVAFADKYAGKVSLVVNVASK